MATIDRIEPAYTPWSPSTAGFPATEDYVGRHRAPDSAPRASLFARMFHRARHRRR